MNSNNFTFKIKKKGNKKIFNSVLKILGFDFPNA